MTKNCKETAAYIAINPCFPSTDKLILVLTFRISTCKYCDAPRVVLFVVYNAQLLYNVQFALSGQ